jgi:hypothetical protein
MTKCTTYDKRGNKHEKEIKREREKGQTNIDKRGGGGKSDRMKCTFGHNFQPIRNLTNFNAFTHQNPIMNI